LLASGRDAPCPRVFDRAAPARPTKRPAASSGKARLKPPCRSRNSSDIAALLSTNGKIGLRARLGNAASFEVCNISGLLRPFGKHSFASSLKKKGA